MSASRQGLLFVVSAPSGAGKTSLVAALIDQAENLRVCVSHTTRPRRSRERDGVDYHFVEAAEFQSMIADSKFLEHAEVFGNHYGTAIQSVQNHLNAGEDLILEIDWQGAMQVRQLMPEAISIFIIPPSREVLEQRLRGRGQDDDAVIARRLSEAQLDISKHREFEYLVVNDDFQQAVADLQAIVAAERLRTAPQSATLAAKLSQLLA